MATSPVRAVQINLGVNLSTNNIRRNVATFSNNFITLDGGVVTAYRTLAAGGTWSYQPPSSPSSIIVVQTSGPILADMTLNPVTANPPTVPVARLAQSYQVIINRTLVMDDDIQSIIFTNGGAADVQVQIVAG